MDPRLIVRPLRTLQCVVVMAAMLTGACAQMLGIEDLPPLPSDGGPNDFAVQGTAAGVLGPVALELRLGDDVELLAVTQEGTFTFETRLKDGTSYTVVLVNPDVPCTLRKETGVVTGADTAIELTCTVPALMSVVVSGIAPRVILVPDTTTYEVELPLLQQSVTLTAAVATVGDTLTIAGTPIVSGAPSTSITLSLGDNAVDIVVENDLGWQQTYHLILRRAAQIAQYAYGKASNGGHSDLFGYSVALSGHILAVGAPLEDSAATGVNGNQDDNGAHESGTVYVFRRTGTAWLQEAYLKASNSGAGDQFGISVALAGDTLVVGAPLEDSVATGVNGNQNDNAVPNSGAVYVFRRTGSAWLQEAYLKASNTGDDDQFGTSVALSGDTLAVGGPLEDSAAMGVNGNQNDNSARDSGAVYVFRRMSSIWQPDAYIKASNTGAGNIFGWSVALSDDTLAVGGPLEDSAATGVNGNQSDSSASQSGATYVFRRTEATWLQEAYMKASNTGSGDNFGHSVALSGDTLAVGALSEDSAATGVNGNQNDDSVEGSGAVYMFRRTGSAWLQEAYLKASNAGDNDQFGFRVALSGDTLAVGTLSEDSAATGVNGNQNDNAVPDSGAVYVFRRTGSAWLQEAYLKASNAGVDDQFGTSVALSGDTLAVGAPYEDSAATGVNGSEANDSVPSSGAVYIFH